MGVVSAEKWSPPEEWKERVGDRGKLVMTCALFRGPLRVGTPSWRRWRQACRCSLGRWCSSSSSSRGWSCRCLALKSICGRRAPTFGAPDTKRRSDPLRNLLYNLRQSDLSKSKTMRVHFAHVNKLTDLSFHFMHNSLSIVDGCFTVSWVCHLCIIFEKSTFRIYLPIMFT